MSATPRSRVLPLDQSLKQGTPPRLRIDDAAPGGVAVLPWHSEKSIRGWACFHAYSLVEIEAIDSNVTLKTSEKRREKKKKQRIKCITTSWTFNLTILLFNSCKTNTREKGRYIYVLAAQRERSYTNSTSCYIQLWHLSFRIHMSIFTFKAIYAVS